jgi:hypothetical protein
MNPTDRARHRRRQVRRAVTTRRALWARTLGLFPAHRSGRRQRRIDVAVLASLAGDHTFTLSLKRPAAVVHQVERLLTLERGSDARAR